MSSGHLGDKIIVYLMSLALGAGSWLLLIALWCAGKEMIDAIGLMPQLILGLVGSTGIFLFIYMTIRTKWFND